MEKRNELTADVIEVTVSGAFKEEHLFSAAGGLLGALQINALKSTGLFQDRQGTALTFEKTNFWKSHYALKTGGVTLASAAPRRALRRAFTLQYGEQELTLAPGGSKFRSWRLFDGQGGAICEILPRGALKRGAWILVLSPADLALLVFAYCLVNRRWQEESSAA